MFILIAPVNRIFGSGSNDPFDWNMMRREGLINSLLVEIHEKRTESTGLKAHEFNELIVEQQGNTLWIDVFGEKYTPCPPPEGYDAMEQLNKEFKLLRELIEQGEIEANKIVIDFGRVQYMNSEGLGTLIALRKVLAKHGSSIEFQNVNPQLMEVLEVTHLDKLFKIF